MTKLLAFTALMAGLWLAGAWAFMLTVGVVHADWIPQLPTVSYRVALLLSAIAVMRTFAGAFIGSISKTVLDAS